MDLSMVTLNTFFDNCKEIDGDFVGLFNASGS
ncbi:hypothetical protein SAMN05421797_102281 [Maribacter ulvicola]|uniref:Uncharacterized protein n=1 Tax=Maribacter ulvicola TaxID=228959 RepID=A0A1N6UBP0_9FLAO|nr:hypothetical protein SAMN05421797_102281 [Maribacter ulvicola]